MHYVFLLILFVSAVKASRLKGKPVPGAKLLDQVLSRFLNKSDYTDTVFEYLRGDNNARRRSVDLGVGVLDRENVRKIIENIKTRYEKKNYRRKNEAYYSYSDNKAIKETALDMMRQSIYTTKDRMNDTRRFRKVYANNPSFYIAMYYGALMQVSEKLETLYTIISRLDKWTHFLWFLVIYEKILAANVDAHDMADRIFDLQTKHVKRLMGERIELAPTIRTTAGPTKRSRRRRTRTRPAFTVAMSTFPKGPGYHDSDENETRPFSSEDERNATSSKSEESDSRPRPADSDHDYGDKPRPGFDSDEDKRRPRPGSDEEDDKDRERPPMSGSNENYGEGRPNDNYGEERPNENYDDRPGRPKRGRAGRLINMQRYF